MGKYLNCNSGENNRGSKWCVNATGWYTRVPFSCDTNEATIPVSLALPAHHNAISQSFIYNSTYNNKAWSIQSMISLTKRITNLTVIISPSILKFRIKTMYVLFKTIHSFIHFHAFILKQDNILFFFSKFVNVSLS